AGGDRQTARAGSPCPPAPRTRRPSPRPATASAGARRPARPAPGSVPSPSRGAAGARPPTPPATRSGVCSCRTPLPVSIAPADAAAEEDLRLDHSIGPDREQLHVAVMLSGLLQLVLVHGEHVVVAGRHDVDHLLGREPICRREAAFEERGLVDV